MSVFTKDAWHPLLCPSCKNPMLYATNEIMDFHRLNEDGSLNLYGLGLPFYVYCKKCFEEHYPSLGKVVDGEAKV